MAQQSAIEWTEATWNPVTGCSKVSSGCKNCYAERMAGRLKAMGQPRYKHGFRTTTHADLLSVPLTWRRPKMIFVNSMSDLFHEDVSDTYIASVFDVMNAAEHHTFQVLTKRADRLNKLSDQLIWGDNIWMGVSVESAQYYDRIEHLIRVPALVRFLSLEPMLGRMSHLPLAGIHWVIAGGESGPRARPLESIWVREVRDQCAHTNVPFFFKQWGGTRKKQSGRLLDGRIWDGTPGAKGISHERLTTA